MALQQISAALPKLPTASTQKPVAPAPSPAASPAASSPAAPPAAVDAEQVQQAIEQVRKAVDPVAQNLQFSIDNSTGKTVVKVVDAKTEEVIRQIPSDELLSIARALDRLQGLLVNKKV